MPELITSIIAIIKNNEELAIGNIIGSCIMNILFSLGIGAAIKKIEFEYSFNQTIFLLSMGFSVYTRDKKIKRNNGIVLVSIFALYFIKLFI